ncbi:MAG: 30S ribosomal protein S18 [Chlamydiae bacterium SM23_39]|nr:MAG: 30S ribosomal protein S18 [Chlamydiae bacterium SM23_39]
MPKNFVKQKRICPFKINNFKDIDYKDVETLKKFITDKGKIIPRRITGVSSYFQKLLKNAIKKARYMAFLPFVSKE